MKRTLFFSIICLLAGITQQSAVADSLWSGATISQTSYFADQPIMPRRVNDIIFILIDESTAANTQVDSNIKAEPKMGGEVTDWFNVKGWKNILNIFKGKSAELKTVNAGTLPKWGVDVKNEFKGEGETTRVNAVETKIAARIVEINPNGNMVLEARRNIQVNRETCELMLTGIARPDDIDQNNQIESSKIADLRIAVLGQGELSRYSQPGLITRLLGFLQ